MKPTTESDVGIGLTTTCGYNLVGNKVEAGFVHGVFASRILNGTVQHFLGWMWPHATTVPVAEHGNSILTLNLEKYQAYVVAWGNSGGKKYAMKMANIINGREGGESN